MTTLLPPTPSSTSSFPFSQNLIFNYFSTTSSTTITCKATNSSFQPQPSNPTSLITTKNQSLTPPDNTLLTLLQQRKTDEAWLYYTKNLDNQQLPNPTCLSRLVSQLSYQNSTVSLHRTQSIIQRLRNGKQLHRLDANSLGLLASAAAKGGHVLYASSIIKSMLKSGYLPHVKAWSSVVSRLANSGDDGPVEALGLFNAVVRIVRRFSDQDLIKHSQPDTAAYNAVLNACANLGDKNRFLELFDEIGEFDCEPDRKDLLVFVLERILEKGIPLCMSTFQSHVAAYVGFGDLRDLCKILREVNVEEVCLDDSDVFDRLLPNSVNWRDNEPPELSRVFEPNSRMYTTLMKGYMSAGRVTDMVRMLEAMRHLGDSESHPDHVTHTTVISAFVKQVLMDRAREMLAEMVRIGVPANRITDNVLSKGYCQQLHIDRAEELIKEMIDTGIEPDVVSYNTIIDRCILVDDSAGALSYFNEMGARGIAPSKVSYTTLMKAFASSAQAKLANKVFDEMLKDPRVKVDLVAWNMLQRVIERMKENGFYPNVATYGSLANGIALARKPGEALLLWNEIKHKCGMGNGEESDPSGSPPLEPDEGLLDTLADICVRAAFFWKALEIVACMELHGIPPNKTKFTRIYVEMHSRMFTSKHASRARQDRRKERKRAAEAFKFWLGLPNSCYGSEWRLDSVIEDEYGCE
ncbi:unnamed protein product [Withania somnifera]